MPGTRLIVGCGYLGRRVAQLWIKGGIEVHAVTRRPATAKELAAHGIRPIVADVTKRETLKNLPPVEACLFAVGFDRLGGADIHGVYAGGVFNVLDALADATQRFLYISTTGVYGSAQGDWVDEDTRPDPQRDGGQASLAAEEILSERPISRNSVILRLAGIYGPGRVPYLNNLRAGEPISAPDSGWLNLIHVDDAARIVGAADAWTAARTSKDGPHLFCVSDGAPVIRADYYSEAARLLGAPPPTFVTPPRDAPAALRATVSRRVSNSKLQREFDVRLAYPTYREGLAAILSADY